jgi:hypothetical protein
METEAILLEDLGDTEVLDPDLTPTRFGLLSVNRTQMSQLRVYDYTMTPDGAIFLRLEEVPGTTMPAEIEPVGERP